MTQPIGEPTTEEEAQTIKRFLEQGADVTLELIRQFEATATELAAPESAVMIFPETQDLLDQLSHENEDTMVLVTLDFPGELRPDFVVRVFLNRPDADASADISDPGFVGTLAFFCHAEDSGVGFVCMPEGGAPLRFRLPLTIVLARVELVGPVTVTLVPVPFPERTLTEQTVSVIGSIDIVRSDVSDSP